MPSLIRKFSLIALVLILVTAISAAVFFYYMPEGVFSKIMCYYIARELTRNAGTFETKVEKLRNFVHENVNSVSGYPNRPDTVAIDKLISGTGWCDQQSRVFMQLASNVGITTRLLFLLDSKGSSPHSVAEALSPDGRWIIVDAAYNLDLRNKSGNLATQDDVAGDPAIISENIRVKPRAVFEPGWADKKYIEIYVNRPSYIVTKKGRPHILDVVPLPFVRAFSYVVQKIYFARLSRQLDTYTFKASKARMYHLLGYYKKAGELYEEVIKNSPDDLIRYKAEFHYALMLKDEKKYAESYDYISTLMKNGEKDQYLYGLRASVLKKMGRPKEAEEDLLKIRYSLDAS